MTRYIIFPKLGRSLNNKMKSEGYYILPLTVHELAILLNVFGLFEDAAYLEVGNSCFIFNCGEIRVLPVKYLNKT